MKQAFLITAYKDFESLFRLAELLAGNGFVYIHADAKSRSITREEINKLNTIKNCRAINTYKIAWGGFCHVLAFLDLMKMALDNPEVSYIHCITGEDFPVISPEEMDRRYAASTKIYMPYMGPDDLPETVMVRYRYFNWFPDKNVKNPVLWQIQNLTVNLQKICGIKRSGIGEFRHIYKGLVYVSMPRNAAIYVADYCQKNPGFLKDLRRCQVPEEFFFQTLFLNSEYAKDVEDCEIRYLNWEKGEKGSPAYLDMSDYQAIREGDYAFARKFHPEKSKEILEKIYAEIREMN